MTPILLIISLVAVGLFVSFIAFRKKSKNTCECNDCNCENETTSPCECNDCNCDTTTEVVDGNYTKYVKVKLQDGSISTYKARKKDGVSYGNYADYDYFDEFGNLIETIFIMEAIFDFFDTPEYYDGQPVDPFVNEIEEVTEHYIENEADEMVSSEILDDENGYTEENTKEEPDYASEPEYSPEPDYSPEPTYEDDSRRSYSEPNYESNDSYSSSDSGSFDSGGGDW